MTPQALTLDPITAGDTWPGIPSISIRISVNGVSSPPSSPLKTVRMRFAQRLMSLGDVVELSSSSPDEILITSAANWEFSIPPQAVPSLTEGSWRWNLETTADDGTVATYLAGEFPVLPDV